MNKLKLEYFKTVTKSDIAKFTVTTETQIQEINEILADKTKQSSLSFYKHIVNVVKTLDKISENDYTIEHRDNKKECFICKDEKHIVKLKYSKTNITLCVNEETANYINDTYNRKTDKINHKYSQSFRFVLTADDSNILDIITSAVEQELLAKNQAI